MPQTASCAVRTRRSPPAVDLQIDLAPGSPLRLQLEEELRAAIRSGRLLPGSLLPPSRVLAQELGVSRGAVGDSYSQLVAEGYLAARRGSGTRVATLPTSPPLPAAPAPRQLTPFRYDLPPGPADFHAFPRRRWQAALPRALRGLPDTRLTYAAHRGAPELRVAIAAYLRRARAVIAAADQVVVSGGGSAGLIAVL